MPLLILGICLLIGLVLLAKWFVEADPKVIIRAGRYIGIGLLVTVIGFLAVTRQLGTAISVLVLVMPLILRWRAIANRFRAARGPREGQFSTVETAYLWVNLDHDTGRMAGTVTQGRFAGRALESFSLGELRDLLAECAGKDPRSAAILEAYLDRIHGPEWREQPAGAGSGGAGGGAGGGTGRGPGGRMSREEAYSVLGLQPGASDTEIKEAHRRLMKKFHPDQGGTDYLASKLNEAKDVLLRS